jgi:hypothetical protein
MSSELCQVGYTSSVPHVYQMPEGVCAQARCRRRDGIENIVRTKSHPVIAQALP